MEGKEVRFGIANSALFTTITTDASCGAVNNMHDSLLPIAGMVPMGWDGTVEPGAHAGEWRFRVADGAPPPERADDDQALSDASLGQVTDRSDPSEDSIDHSGGDEADATSHSGTGANAAEIKEEMKEGEAVPWVQAANVARENTNEDETAEGS